MKKKLREVINDFMKIIRKPEMQILPGQIAFYFLMSFIPILALVALVTSHLINSFDLIKTIESSVPAVLSSIITSLVNSASSSSSLFLLIGAYLILGSNGPQSIIIASDTLYGIKTPGALKLKIKSIIMIFIIVILLIFMIFVPVFGDIIIKTLISFADFGDKLRKFAPFYTVIKLFFTFIIIYFSIKLLYTIAPDAKIKSKETTVGAIFTAISWMVATQIFAFYITNLANYNELYGNFANILILLLWLYILAYLFVVGMALNINKYQNNVAIKD